MGKIIGFILFVLIAGTIIGSCRYEVTKKDNPAPFPGSEEIESITIQVNDPNVLEKIYDPVIMDPYFLEFEEISYDSKGLESQTIYLK